MKFTMEIIYSLSPYVLKNADICKQEFEISVYADNSIQNTNKGLDGIL